MQCFGITKKKERCKNSTKFLFCYKHSIYYWGIAVVIGVLAGLYQDLISPIFISKEDITKLFIDGTSYLDQGNTKTSERFFEKAYKANSAYKSLAYKYGYVLLKNNKPDEALAVWAHIPSSENHENLLYWKAIAYKELKLFGKYKDNLSSFIEKSEGTDNSYYWVARTKLLISDPENKNLNKFEKNINDFMLEIVAYKNNTLKDIEIQAGTPARVVEHIAGGDKVKVANLVLLDNAKFILFRNFARRYFNLSKNEESFSYYLKALESRSTPFLSPMPVTERDIISILQEINSVLLRFEKEGVRERKYTLLHSALLNITNKEESHKICNYCDLAKIISALNGEILSSSSVKSKYFSLKYKAGIKSHVSINKISFRSPSYILGEGEIEVNNRKSHSFQRVVKVTHLFGLGQLPSLELIVTNNLKTGDCCGASASLDLYPEILYSQSASSHQKSNKANSADPISAR